MANNNYLKCLFLENNDPIFAKSTSQILSLNLEYTFLLLNFFITGSCNYLRCLRNVGVKTNREASRLEIFVRFNKTVRFKINWGVRT